MDYHFMSDKAIVNELGRRFRELRLRKNLTQAELAKRALISLNTVKRLEQGNAKMSTIVLVLRELSALGQLDLFLPDPGISPMQIARLKGTKRKRASGKSGKKDKSAEVPEW